MFRPATFAFILCLSLGTLSHAAEWVPISTNIMAAEKVGYGGMCGVLVERPSGDVYVNVSDNGMYRSQDQGKTWSQLGKGFKGRTETPGCMLFDPTGKSKRLAIVLVYGAPITMSADHGTTWQTMNSKASHVDWGAFDWTDPESKFVLTLKHESGGLLLSSHDGGKSFEDLAKGYGPAWIFDDKTAVAVQGKKIVRTTDGGKAWSPSGEYSARALPRWYGDKLYWLTDSALITTSDKGEKWSKVCDVKNGFTGPIFGKDAKHMLILTKDGVIESTDGGSAWSAALALPKESKGASNMTWLDYDPQKDILYTSKMATDVYKLERK